MKIVKELVFNFMRDNKMTYVYILMYCVILFLEVIVASRLYIKFFDNNIDKVFGKIVRDVCILWITLYILYYMVSKIDSKILPDFRNYIRKSLITRYLESSEICFNEKDIEKDNLKLLDVGFFIDYVFSWIIKTFIPTFFLSIIMNIYFFTKSPVLGIIQLISNIINYYVIKRYWDDIYHSMTKRRESHEKSALNLYEMISNLVNIYVYGNMKNELNKNDKYLDEYKNRHNKELSVVNNVMNELRANIYMTTILSIVFLYKTAKSSKKFLDIFSIFLLYIPIFQNFIKEIPTIAYYFPDIYEIIKGLEENNKLMNNKDIDLVYNGYIHNDFNFKYKGYIKIDSVSYSYDKSSQLFNNFSLEILAKERVAIMGSSGKGKTTLCKLLLNFISPDKGVIYFDGVDIKTINHRILRKNIIYVNQRTLLFNDTIMNNLKYGNGKSDKEIISFIEKYGLNIILSDLTKIVDINGKNISLGMQKIIYLIRSILQDHCLYIFDEPLTSLDLKTRESIIKMIDDNTKGKTVIIITHDIEIVDILDRIINI